MLVACVQYWLDNWSVSQIVVVCVLYWLMCVPNCSDVYTVLTGWLTCVPNCGGVCTVLTATDVCPKLQWCVYCTEWMTDACPKWQWYMCCTDWRVSQMVVCVLYWLTCVLTATWSGPSSALPATRCARCIRPCWASAKARRAGSISTAQGASPAMMTASCGDWRWVTRSWPCYSTRGHHLWWQWPALGTDGE